MEEKNKKEIIYVLAGNFGEYNEYIHKQKELGSEAQFEYIQDHVFLRGRMYGEIVILGDDYMNRLDAAGILDSIDIAKREWKNDRAFMTPEDDELGNDFGK